MRQPHKSGDRTVGSWSEGRGFQRAQEGPGLQLRMPSPQQPHFQSKCVSPLRLRPLLESYFYKALELLRPPQFHNLPSEFTSLTEKTGGLYHSSRQPCLSRDGNSNETKWDRYILRETHKRHIVNFWKWQQLSHSQACKCAANMTKAGLPVNMT